MVNWEPQPRSGGTIMDMNQPLGSKVALVTGASRGIGLAIARTLGGLGAKLGICSRNAKEIAAAARDLRSGGFEVHAMPADVSQAASAGSFVSGCEQALGPAEILVNNAGIGYFGAFHEADEAHWDAVLDTNLKSVFLLGKAVAAGMIERRSGQIINIGSLAGKNAFAGGAIYCSSKWGLLGLTQCMAEDLRAYGIRVSAICPGSVITGFSQPNSRPKDETKMLRPEDVARIVGLLVTQDPQSFISEILIRPTQKP